MLHFGTYVHIHNKTKNTMEARTSGAIALWPTGNLQGGHYFPCLPPGKWISQKHWTVLPAPNEVITFVNNMGKANRLQECLDFGDSTKTVTTKHNQHGRFIKEEVMLPPAD